VHYTDATKNYERIAVGMRSAEVAQIDRVLPREDHQCVLECAIGQTVFRCGVTTFLHALHLRGGVLARYHLYAVRKESAAADVVVVCVSVEDVSDWFVRDGPDQIEEALSIQSRQSGLSIQFASSAACCAPFLARI
jgi:hypothetical protein